MFCRHPFLNRSINTNNSFIYIDIAHDQLTCTLIKELEI